MSINQFALENGLERSSCPADEALIKQAETVLDITFGNELREYLCNCGYLAFSFVELFGINSQQGIKSDMVEQTLYLHKYFPATKDFIALEDQGDGDYYIINSNDEVFEFDSSLNEITAKHLSLSQYIFQRFQDSAK